MVLFISISTDVFLLFLFGWFCCLRSILWRVLAYFPLITGLFHNGTCTSVYSRNTRVINFVNWILIYFIQIIYSLHSCYTLLRLICDDITNGQEAVPIPATNLVDDPPVPPPPGKLSSWFLFDFPAVLVNRVLVFLYTLFFPYISNHWVHVLVFLLCLVLGYTFTVCNHYHGSLWLHFKLFGSRCELFLLF